MTDHAKDIPPLPRPDPNPHAQQLALRAVLRRYDTGRLTAVEAHTVLDTLGLLAVAPRTLPLTASARAKARRRAAAGVPRSPDATSQGAPQPPRRESKAETPPGVSRQGVSPSVVTTDHMETR